MKNYLYRFGCKAQLLGGLVITVLGNALFFFTAYAQTTAQGIQISNVSQINTSILCPIFNAIFSVLMVVSIIMILWGGFTYMRAQDDAEKVHRATLTITYAVVGIVVALCAKAAPNVIGSIFSVTSLTSC
jgi:hypothetical protein